jgi:hypothetical protein
MIKIITTETKGFLCKAIIYFYKNKEIRGDSLRAEQKHGFSAMRDHLIAFRL